MSDMLQLVVGSEDSPALEVESSAPQRQAEACRTFVDLFLTNRLYRL